ncbi:senescence-specific cysteine protease SAG12-like [Miscanthus floridulus]|uniref:senescence-specific cysteine protease SAG12-like n=1 Tax=Miscanthus floridulus TaxID=154761 RepID=UPI003457AF28
MHHRRSPSSPGQAKAPAMARSPLLLVLLAAVWISGAALARAEPMLERFEQWMGRHGRLYADAGEKQRRLEVYRRNVELVESFNSMSNGGYKLADNKFADLTNEEFRAKMLGFGRPHGRAGHTTTPSTVACIGSGLGQGYSELPKSVDWREKGAVAPVKNQGECGSCWAFSAVAAIEGINQIKNGKLVSLSEQELVDCDTKAVGCAGGYMSWAFEFVMKNGGLTTERNYPYQGMNGACQTPKLKESAVSISGYVNVTASSETDLLRAAAAQPVSVAVDAGSFVWQLYGGGVFTGPCTADLNHGVTVVGYGETQGGDTDGDGSGVPGQKYWIVKNSWGAEWGDAGYILVQREASVASGLCGIALLPSYPVM